ncbi:threonine dehydratase [Herbihabitans rhizosphaerae]|uniref:Threonine dehydratase n=1 Tax=Herbihabitans rhizosphaerae TaxID=1872711 RepID=A0A4Q7KJW9_9PSEU|nr:pyridoxal-phosphate dependent enzyme [Herbihabitans rhizosphaerae]RZS36849.1 threonine dehydratase [Herbihabitans rhizosphaerae]
MDLDLERIERAATTVNPVFLNSPQWTDDTLAEALGRRVLAKLETANPLRSFKGRGADFAAAEFDPSRPVVCASSGNFGQAMAYACRARGIPVEVFVPDDINPGKRARMEAFGAKVIPAGVDGNAAGERAVEHAGRTGARYVKDGDLAAISEGAGTIGVELLRGGTTIDTVIVPVGDGALITGVARWVKEHSPHTRIVGVSAVGAPAMERSWRAGEPRPTESIDTVAEGIAIRTPVANSVARMGKLVDDMVLVDDKQMFDAMALAVRTIGVLLEPSGAAGLAALAVHEIPGDTVATVLTGSNLRPEHLGTAL